MNPSISTGPSSIRYALLAGLGAWFSLALLASVLGVFDSSSRPPIGLGLAAALPPVAYLLISRRWNPLGHAQPLVSLSTLTLLQTWRVGGFVFLILYRQSLLPASFALPAGYGDIAIGATAPVMAWLLLKRPLAWRVVYLVWTLLGIFDLIMAVSLGVLSSASSVGILADGVTTRLMGQFPLSLIPTFFVPALVIAHLAALKAWRQGSADRAPVTLADGVGPESEGTGVDLLAEPQ
jgi:hypothetical protein